MADDVAQLGLEIDSKSTLEAAAALRHFETIAKRTGETVDQVAARYKRLGDEHRRNQSATEGARREQERHNRENRRSVEELTVMQRLLREMTTQMGMFAGNLGRIGSLMTALGPGGLATAAALAVLTLGFKQLADAALSLAKVSGDLVDFSETTGFTVLQLQALQKAAAQVGVDGPKLTQGLERFSRGMVDVRKATGETWEQLLELDHTLADQIRTSKDLAGAWDLLSRAIKKAPLEQANKIAQAFFGRGGTGMTRALRATAEAGGLEGVISQLNKLDRITLEQAKHWDDLGDRIAENSRLAAQNVKTVFATPVLTALDEVTAGLLVLSRQLRLLSADAKDAPPTTGGWIEWLQKMTAAAQNVNPVTGPIRTLIQILRDLGKVQRESATQQAASQTGNRFDDAFTDAENANIQGRVTALTALYNIEKARVEAKGGAATAQDKLILKEREIAMLMAKNPKIVQEATEALRDYKAELGTAALQARIGLLGDMARVEDALIVKQREINEANKQGAGITREQTAAILEREAIRFQASIPENQVALQKEMVFLTEEEGRIRQQMIGWGISMNSERGKALALEMRTVDAMKQTKDFAADFAKTFVQGLAQGKSAMEALGGSLTQLGSKLIDSGIMDLMSGNFIMGGLKTAGGLLASIFGRAAQKAKEAQEAWQKLLDDLDVAASRAQSFLERRQLAGIDTSTVSGGLKEFDIRAVNERAEEAKKQFPQMLALEAALIAERLALLKEFKKDALDVLNAGDDPLSETAQRLKDIKDAADQLNKVIKAGGSGTGITAADVLAEQAEAIANLRNDFIAELQSHMGKGFTGQIADLFKSLPGVRADAKALGVDQALVTSSFMAQVQAVIDGAGLTGKAFDDLIKMFPQLTGKVHESADAIREAAEAQAEAARAAAEAAAAARAAFVAERTNLVDRLHATRQDPNTMEGALAMFDRGALREMQEAIKNGSQNIKLLEKVLAAERLDILREFKQRAAEEAKAEAAARIKTISDLNDRLLTVRTDATTLEGQLTLLDRRHLRERQSFADKTQEEITRLQMVHDAERLDLIKEFHDKQVAEEKRAQEERLRAQEQSARQIVDYITGLFTGESSGLSPLNRLAAAQSAYNAILATAQGDPQQQATIDALQRITQDAENLRQALEAVYGVGTTPYQQGIATIASQLTGLPAVQQSQDPIVVDMTGVITALAPLVAISTNTGNTVSGLTPIATNTGNTVSGLTPIATNTGNTVTNTGVGGALEAAINGLDFASAAGSDLVLTLAEFTATMTGKGISAPTISALFDAMDTNNDNLVTQAEHLQAIAANTGSTATNTGNTVTGLGSSTTDTVVSTLGTTETGGLRGVLVSIDNDSDAVMRYLTITQASRLVNIESDAEAIRAALVVTTNPKLNEIAGKLGVLSNGSGIIQFLSVIARDTTAISAGIGLASGGSVITHTSKTASGMFAMYGILSNEILKALQMIEVLLFPDTRAAFETKLRLFGLTAAQATSAAGNTISTIGAYLRTVAAPGAPLPSGTLPSAPILSPAQQTAAYTQSLLTETAAMRREMNAQFNRLVSAEVTGHAGTKAAVTTGTAATTAAVYHMATKPAAYR